jgi:hypothetical protein
MDQHPAPSDSPLPQTALWERRPIRAALGVLFVLLATGVALARNGRPWFADILYAEDGSHFYAQARELGLEGIVEPYAGYMHLVPRVASEAITVLPADQVAAAYSIVATLAVGLLALYVFFAARVLLDSWVSRALLAASLVVLPLAGETVANLANLHWYLMFATFWALVFLPPNRWWVAAGAAVGLAAALSDPLTALLLPTAALAVYRYRSRLHGIVVGAVVLGLTVQLLVVLGAEAATEATGSWSDLPALYAFRVAGGLTIGDVHLGTAWLRAGWSVPVVAIVAVTLLVVVTIAVTDGWRRVIVIAAVGNSVLFYGVSLIFRGTESLVPVVGQPAPLFSGRYTLVPALLIVVCVAVLFDNALATRTLPAVIVGGIATIWLVVAMAANLLIEPLPNGPSWEESLVAARNECSVDPNAPVVVEIAPHPTWVVYFFCEEL